MRVFLDTNVVVSAILTRGLCRDLLKSALEDHTALVSKLVIVELTNVLRDKIGISEPRLKNALTILDDVEVVSDSNKPPKKSHLEPNDALIIEAAFNADADVFVTGDRGILTESDHLPIEVISPRGFMHLTRDTDTAYPDPSESNGEHTVSEPKENPVKDKSFDFALKIIRLYQKLQDQREYVLSKQLLRSGTSIGANVEEAMAAESRKDFIHKMKIAMKESREAHYWLRLLDQSDITQNLDLSELLNQCDELSRMLTSITKTAIENAIRG